MKQLMNRLLLGALLAATVSNSAGATAASELIKQYLTLPHPSEDGNGENTAARRALLLELSRAPDALPAIQASLPAVSDAGQRAELVEIAGRNVQTKESAAWLAELLKDPDERVRATVVHGLRLISRRTDRSGGKRIPRGPDHAPKVEGLVPHLLCGAGDISPRVRLMALFALADAREPKAAAELRQRLQDPSREVRWHAACFLTEFQDASGLPELKESLRTLNHTGASQEISFYSEAEMVLASLERITGKSFGDIPMDPGLSSNLSDAARSRDRYALLLRTWADWWDWSPAAAAK